MSNNCDKRSFFGDETPKPFNLLSDSGILLQTCVRWSRSTGATH